MNVQVVDAIWCNGTLTSIDKCLNCQHHLGRDEILRQIVCSRKPNKTTREGKYKNILKNVEFGNREVKI